MKSPTALVFFSICAVIDFALGCFKWHSVIAGVVTMVFGLPFNLFLFLVFRALGKATDSEASHR
jgi:hypothetical protein